MDYHFRLAPRGGARVSVKEYRDWRSTGTAFRFDEDSGDDHIWSLFCKPYFNLTMKTNLKFCTWIFNLR